MQEQKTKMVKRRFRIGELAKALKVKKFVIRFWEKEFMLKSDRSEGGQRFYTHEDLHVFSSIQNLLYKQGYTIAGAKIQLKKLIAKSHAQTQALPASKITMHPDLTLFKERLLNLHKLLA